MALYVKHLTGEHPHAAAISTSAQADHKGGEKPVVGYISDSMCGLDHSAMKIGDVKTCTLKCVDGGSKFILADRAHKIVYALDDAAQEKAREFAVSSVAPVVPGEKWRCLTISDECRSAIGRRLSPPLPVSPRREADEWKVWEATISSWEVRCKPSTKAASTRARYILKFGRKSQARVPSAAWH